MVRWRTEVEGHLLVWRRKPPHSIPARFSIDSPSRAYRVTTGSSTREGYVAERCTRCVAGRKSVGRALKMFGTQLCGFRS